MSNVNKYLIFFLLAAMVLMLFIPINTTLQTTVDRENVVINLPCSQANISKGDIFEVSTEFSGHGTGLMGFSWDGNEVRLKKFGIYRELNCIVNIKLIKGKTLQLPASMPFSATGGIVPIKPQQHGKWRSFELLL